MLRDQIAVLERELVAVAASVQPPLVAPPPRDQPAVRGREPVAAAAPVPPPRAAPPPAPARAAGPHLLTLGELERARDELAGRVAGLRAARDDRLDRQDAARVALERMLL